VRSIIFVIYIGFIYPLLFYTLKKAIDVCDADWGIEHLNKKESSSSVAILIVAYLVHCVWYAFFCFVCLWLCIASCVLTCYCVDPANVKVTKPERPISEDLAERMGSWFFDRPSFLPPLTPVYTADIQGQHYEAKDEFHAAQLEVAE